MGIKLKRVNCVKDTNISLEIKRFDSSGDKSAESDPMLKDQNNTVKKTIQIMTTIVRSVFLLYPTLISKYVSAAAALLGRIAVFLNTSIFNWTKIKVTKLMTIIIMIDDLKSTGKGYKK